MCFPGQFLSAQAARFSQTHNRWNICRAWPQISLLATAVTKRLNGHGPTAASNEQSANAFWAIEFVGAEGEQIHPPIQNINRELADSLSGIAVDDNAVLVGDVSDGLYRLYDANFIVSCLDGDKQCAIGDHLTDCIQRNVPQTVDGKDGCLETFALELLAR